MNWIGFLIAKSIQIIGTELLNAQDKKLACRKRTAEAQCRSNAKRQGLAEAEAKKADESAKGA